MPYDEQLVIGWHERRLAVQQDAVPAIPFQGQPEADALLLRELEQDAPVLCSLIWLGCLVWVVGSWWITWRGML